MHNWSSVVWALAWAVLFLVTVVGCCRSVAVSPRREAAEDPFVERVGS